VVEAIKPMPDVQLQEFSSSTGQINQEGALQDEQYEAITKEATVCKLNYCG